jgi:hypothetical protein
VGVSWTLRFFWPNEATARYRLQIRELAGELDRCAGDVAISRREWRTVTVPLMKLGGDRTHADPSSRTAPPDPEVPPTGLVCIARMMLAWSRELACDQPRYRDIFGLAVKVPVQPYNPTIVWTQSCAHADSFCYREAVSGRRPAA